MAGYDRQIAYIHTLQAGEAGRNIGFLKWESDQTIHRMEIHIKGLYETDSGMVDMRTEEGLLFDQISFEKGHADYRKKMQGPVLGAQDIPLEKFHTLIFELPGNRKLKADWIQKYKPLEQKQPDKEAIVLNEEKPASKKNSMAGNANLPTEIPSKEDFPEKEIQKENMWKEEIEKDQVQREQENQLHKDQIQKEQMWDEQDQNASRSDSLQQKAIMSKSPQQSNNTIPAGKIYETKWEQLCDLFEKIHPFGDEKEYVKISPGDFYVLRESSQHLAHNSFLLHGYYNYRYLILGKKEMGSIDEYMLGVPGIYHDREIMAAKMFGFTGFESTTKECSQGSFGYYMVGVE